MSDIETLMRSWLDSPEPIKRAHAVARIAIGFDGAAAHAPAVGPEFRRGKPVVSKGCGPCHGTKTELDS